jgi:uncharacterized membrane protein YwaF
MKQTTNKKRMIPVSMILTRGRNSEVKNIYLYINRNLYFALWHDLRYQSVTRLRVKFYMISKCLIKKSNNLSCHLKKEKEVRGRMVNTVLIIKHRLCCRIAVGKALLIRYIKKEPVLQNHRWEPRKCLDHYLEGLHHPKFYKST